LPIALNGNQSENYGALPAIWNHTGLFAIQMQVNVPRLNPSQTGRYMIYLPRRDGRLSWYFWLIMYRDGSPVCRQSHIQ